MTASSASPPRRDASASPPQGDASDDRPVPEASLVDVVHQRVLGQPSIAAALVPDALDALVRETAPLLPPSEVAGVAERVRARATGLGVLEPLLADRAVTEVMVNGPGPVWIEREGRLETSGVVVDRTTVDQLVTRVLAPVGARADRARPLADARLADGSRVHVVVPPLAVDGPCITIRRFGARRIPLPTFTSGDAHLLLSRAIDERRQILISGGASAGKTTLLNSLAGLIPEGERIVTVEDAAELRLPHEHVVRLEARPPSSEGDGEVTIRDLVRAALRMRPDRIVVGECRGPEALDMLQAMNTGHDGSLSTCHANGPDDALRRLETMVLTAADLPLVAVREQIASAVDLVVQVARGRDGTRRVVAVAEVDPDPGAPARTRLLAGADGRVLAPPSRPSRSVQGPVG